MSCLFVRCSWLDLYSLPTALLRATETWGLSTGPETQAKMARVGKSESNKTNCGKFLVCRWFHRCIAAWAGICGRKCWVLGSPTYGIIRQQWNTLRYAWPAVMCHISLQALDACKECHKNMIPQSHALWPMLTSANLEKCTRAQECRKWRKQGVVQPCMFQPAFLGKIMMGNGEKFSIELADEWEDMGGCYIAEGKPLTVGPMRPRFGKKTATSSL